MMLLEQKLPLSRWCDVPGAPEMVALAGGRYLMGGIPDDKFVSAVEQPQHPVVIRPFAIGSAPVTRREWEFLMGGSSLSGHDDFPMVNIAFPDVIEFLGRLSEATSRSYRLPSEAEWEYACRAGSNTVFPVGNDLQSKDANFLYDERGHSIGIGRLTAVRSFPANAFGLFDLLGNVCEWTADRWHPGYHSAPADGGPWLQGGKLGHRTIRGGAWDHLPRILRPSWRDWAPESARWDNLGFRVACDL
ncbi:MAG: formylglycine-generating enzyme family protein [Akkermansiaceae bacterium]|nr:formylglycine-generating enzyme family protein [Akkermansiaceae bacterium]